jgi:hypothetical protein
MDLHGEQHDRDALMHERRRTCKWFVRGTFLFAAHALPTLAVLAYVFSAFSAEMG